MLLHFVYMHVKWSDRLSVLPVRGFRNSSADSENLGKCWGGGAAAAATVSAGAGGGGGGGLFFSIEIVS